MATLAALKRTVMRVINIRPGHENEDIAAGRALIDAELAHPAKSVMVVCGTSPEIGQLADRAGTRSDAFPWRESIWLGMAEAAARDILGTARFDEWFPNAEGNCAVVLDFDDEIIARLAVDATLRDIEKAFLKA